MSQSCSVDRKLQLSFESSSRQQDDRCKSVQRRCPFVLSNEAGKELRVTDVHSTIVLEALCFVPLTRWTAPSNVLYRKQWHLDFSSHSSSYCAIKPCEQFVDFPLHSGSRMRDKVNGRKSLQKVLLEACQESDGGQHFWPRHDYNHDQNCLRDVLMTPSFRINTHALLYLCNSTLHDWISRPFFEGCIFISEQLLQYCRSFAALSECPYSYSRSFSKTNVVPTRSLDRAALHTRRCPPSALLCNWPKGKESRCESKRRRQ